MKNNVNTNTDKEKWISEVLGSANSMQPAFPPSDLFEKVMIKLNNPEKARIIVIPAKRWAAAAMLLLTLNIGSAIYSIEQNRKTNSIAKSNPITTEMQLESTYNY